MIIKLYKIIFIISFVLCVTSASAIASDIVPAIFFPDMTDGPVSGWEKSNIKGAAVSIWGVNFGAARGTSTVTVCGVTLNQDSDFVEWGATTNPYVPRGMQRITFFLKSAMNTGPSTIQVTTSSGQSNAVPFYCRPLGSNHIYFLDPHGNDNNNGITTSTPWATPKKVRSKLAAGDVAYFREGTYTAIDGWNSVFDFWSNNHANGVANKSITVSSYPGEVAQLGDYSTPKVVGHHGSTLDIWSYWTFSKFNFRGKYFAVGTTDGQDDHIRFVGNDGRTGYGREGEKKTVFDFYAGRGGQSHLYFYGNYVHHCGTDTDTQMPKDNGYPLYIEGSMPGTKCSGYPNCGHHKNLYIGWNEFAFCQLGRGLQLYGHQVFDQVDNVYIHDNWIHDNGKTGAILGGGDGSGGSHPYQFVKNIYFFNNILANNGYNTNYPCLLMGGEKWGSVGGNWYIYNNICYHSADDEIYVSSNSKPTLIEIRNNIIVPLPGKHYYVDNVDKEGNYFRGSNNLYYGAGNGPAWDENRLDNINPRFIVEKPVDFLDFRLSADSPAIGRGYVVDSGSNPILLMNDFLGNVRENTFDIGPYRYNSGQAVAK